MGALGHNDVDDGESPTHLASLTATAYETRYVDWIWFGLRLTLCVVSRNS